MTFRFVSRRRKPSMVNRQNKSPASSMEPFHREAGTYCGCRSQVNASQTSRSISYEVVGRLRIGAQRSKPALPPEQRQCDTLAFALRAHRDDTRNGPAAFGDDDPLLGQILQQRQTLAAELGDADVSH